LAAFVEEAVSFPCSVVRGWQHTKPAKTGIQLRRGIGFPSARRSLVRRREANIPSAGTGFKKSFGLQCKISGFREAP
jgi:hypothetical protein